MSRVFVDTSAFVALRDGRDRDHQAARESFQELAATRASLFTSNYVFAETYTALLVRAGRDEAIRWGSNVRSTQVIDLLRIDQEVEDQAWEILQGHADKSWSYVDATSFALMEREETDQAFAFDRDFVQRGLRVLPSR